MCVAYDYENQEWVTGERGRELRLQQINRDIAAARSGLMPAEWFGGHDPEFVIRELVNEYEAVAQGRVA